MKAFEKMNLKERKAYKNIKNAAIDYIYGLQNGCFDSSNTEEYNNYYNQLNDYEALVDIVYKEAISAVYTGDGAVFGGKAANAYIVAYNIPHEAQFDIITICGTPNNYTIEHFPDAFTPPLTTR